MAARLASGKVVQPRLIADAPRTEPPPLDIADDHLAIVRQGMIDVVNGGGTGARSRLQVDGLQMAGKTGSAQVRRISTSERRSGVIKQERLPWQYRDHALFVAFAPTDAPRYAISVVVEHGAHGASAAAPVARDVFTYLFEPERALATLAPIEIAVAEERRKRTAAEAAAVTGAPQGADAESARRDAGCHRMTGAC